MAETTVDSHHHLWDIDRLHYAWMPPGDNVLKRTYLPDDMRPLLERNGIDRTVIVQAHESLEEARWLIDLAEAGDFIAGAVVWVDLADPGVGHVLDELMKRPGLVGVRHGVEHDPDQAWLTRPASIRGLRELAERGIRYDVLTRPHQLQHVLPIADKLPDLKMVIDHISKPPIASGGMEPWATDVARVAEIPGVYCKVSGMVTEADHANWKYDDLERYVRHVVDIFGFDRLMFGSDWPVCLLASSYDDVVKSALEAAGDIGDEDRAKLMGRNAIDFYGLAV